MHTTRAKSARLTRGRQDHFNQPLSFVTKGVECRKEVNARKDLVRSVGVASVFALTGALVNLFSLLRPDSNPPFDSSIFSRGSFLLVSP